MQVPCNSNEVLQKKLIKIGKQKVEMKDLGFHSGGGSQVWFCRDRSGPQGSVCS